jgi:hypothetical protein
MANARLIDELDRSREAVQRQALVERSLRELGTRISGARDPEAVVQHTIDEALRLVQGDGARIDIVDPDAGQLRGIYSAGQEEILEDVWPKDPNDRLEVGASGRAVVTGRTYISEDYLSDPEIIHGHGPDTYARNKGIHAVIATPLFGDQGPFGAITVWSTRIDAFGPDDAVLLETIAGQSSVALGRARLIEELGRSREALARLAEEEGTLREIGSRLGRLGDDPSGVLLQIVHEAAACSVRSAPDWISSRCRAPDLDASPGRPVHRSADARHAARLAAHRTGGPRGPRRAADRDRRLHGRYALHPLPARRPGRARGRTAVCRRGPRHRRGRAPRRAPGGHRDGRVQQTARGCSRPAGQASIALASAPLWTGWPRRRQRRSEPPTRSGAARIAGRLMAIQERGAAGRGQEAASFRALGP